MQEIVGYYSDLVVKFELGGLVICKKKITRIIILLRKNCDIVYVVVNLFQVKIPT